MKSTSHRSLDQPLPESAFVYPSLAQALSGVRPFILRNMMIPESGPPSVRSVRLRGRRLVDLRGELDAARGASRKEVAR
jgi:hypothetical protein